RPQALEHPRDLAGGPAWQVLAQVGVPEASEGVLAADDGLEQVHVLLGEEVESAVRASRVLSLLAQAGDGLESDSGVVKAREEVEVPAIGSDRKLSKVVKAVDALLQRRQLVRGGAVAMGYRAVVAEPAWVVGRGLDA